MSDLLKDSEKKKVGRKRTKRQSQIHPKVRKEVADAFSEHAMANDMSHGQFFEKVWEFYLKGNLNEK